MVAVKSMLSRSVKIRLDRALPHVLRYAQGRDPASLVHSFNRYSGSAASVAMPPGRFAHRVREVAIAARACQVGHGPWFGCGSEGVLRPTLAVWGRVWLLTAVSWYRRARSRALQAPVNSSCEGGRSGSTAAKCQPASSSAGVRGWWHRPERGPKRAWPVSRSPPSPTRHLYHLLTTSSSTRPPLRETLSKLRADPLPALFWAAKLHLDENFP